MWQIEEESLIFWAKLAIPSHSAPLWWEKIVLKMIKID